MLHTPFPSCLLGDTTQYWHSQHKGETLLGPQGCSTWSLSHEGSITGGMVWYALLGSVNKRVALLKGLTVLCFIYKRAELLGGGGDGAQCQVCPQWGRTVEQGRGGCSTMLCPQGVRTTGDGCSVVSTSGQHCLGAEELYYWVLYTRGKHNLGSGGGQYRVVSTVGSTALRMVGSRSKLCQPGGSTAWGLEG